MLHMGNCLLPGIAAGPGSFTGTSGGAGSGSSHCTAGLAAPLAGICEVSLAGSEITGTITGDATSGSGGLSSST